MTTPKLTDDQLERLAANSLRDMTSLECQLCNVIIDDRKAFRQLIKEIEPMAQQVIHPKDNTFSRQLELIKARL